MSAQPSAGQDAALLGLTQVVEANGQARQALTDNLIAAVRALIEEFHGWYDDLAVLRLAKQISGLVGPAQKVMASQEDAYLAHVSSLLGDRTYRPVGQVVVDDLRAGVDPEQVYERLAKQFRYERSTDTPEPAALEHVLTRAGVMNQMDVALVARSQAEKFFQAHAIKGYRRIVHPELSKGGACGLCIAASTRIYKADRLLPIHDRCHCGVMPILGGWDAGDSLNNLDLSKLYTDAGSTAMRDLKRTRYKVDEHGELGPVLVPKKRAGGGVGSPSSPASASGLKDISDDVLAHQINVTEGLKPSEWRTSQLARLKAEQARRAS